MRKGKCTIIVGNPDGLTFDPNLPIQVSRTRTPAISHKTNTIAAMHPFTKSHLIRALEAVLLSISKLTIFPSHVDERFEMKANGARISIPGISYLKRNRRRRNFGTVETRSCVSFGAPSGEIVENAPTPLEKVDASGGGLRRQACDLPRDEYEGGARVGRPTDSENAHFPR